MIHEPVALLIEWLSAQDGVTAETSHISSVIEDDTTLPAIAIPTYQGGPVAAESTVYDWMYNVYVVAGRTGKGSRYPDSQTAAVVAGTILDAVRALAVDGVSWQSTTGAVIIDAAVDVMTRDVDSAGNALVTISLSLRVAE